MTSVIIDCDPGHDDAIALLLALASPEIDLVGVTTVHGNQTLEKTTDNALRVLALVGREDVPLAMGADRPLEREPHVAAHVHGESGLDGPELPPRCVGADRPARRRLPRGARRRPRPCSCRSARSRTSRSPSTRAMRPARIVLMGGAVAEGNMTPAAEFNIWADPRPRSASSSPGST